MLYVNRLVRLLFLCTMTLSACLDQKSETERTKTMNKSIDQKKSGQFLTKDKQDNAIILEWHKTNLIAPDFAAAMKDAWIFARDAYTTVEMQFLKAFPAVVGKEPYFKSFERLFENGFANVDWKAVEEIMQSILQGHFVFDPAKFPEQMKKMYENDQAFFVIAKDAKTGNGLGLITFMIRANYAVGDVKVMSFAVDVAHQKRGLGKLLMCSIFRIVRDIKRIFLCTRVTNKIALNAYSSWGFVIDQKPVLDHAFNLDHWTFMEYKTEQSDLLQKVAASLTE